MRNGGVSASLFSVPAFLVLLVAGLHADETFNKLFDEGKYAEVIKYADEKLPIADRNASVWAKLGVAHEEQKLDEKALACYLVAIRNDAKNYEAHLGAARIYNNIGQPSSAADLAKKAMELKSTGEASWEYARSCIAQNKTKEAKAALEKVVETDKSNVVANRELGNIFYGEKNFEKALPLMKLAYHAKPDGETAYKIAQIFTTQKSPDSAIVYYKEALKDKKLEKPEAGLELARLYFQAGKHKQAAEEYEKVDQKLLTTDDLYNHAFSAEKAGKDKDETGKLYEAAVQKFGASNAQKALLAKEKVARWKLDKKAYKDALVLLQDISKADPGSKVVKDVTFLMAEAYDGSGERSKAIPLLEAVIAKEPDNVEAVARLADLYNKQKMSDKAQALYSKLLSLQPNNPNVYLALGEYSLKSKKYDEALRHFQKSFTLEKTARAAEGMMLSAWELKDYQLASDAAESALRIDGSMRQPKITLSNIHIQEKNYSAAINILEKLHKEDPSDLDILKKLALCFEKSGKADKLAETDKAIAAADKKDTVSRLRYAKYLQSKGDNEAALGMYKELSTLQPREPEIPYNMYQIALKMGNKDDAVVHLRKYVQLKPQDAKAQRDLGNMLYDKKDSDGALAAYRAALKHDPAIKGFYKKYADLILAQKPKAPVKGQKSAEDEVIDVLNSAVKAGEADEEIYSTLAEIYQKKGNYEQASQMYQKALQLKPQNPEMLAALAFCQEKAGKVSDAIISYEQVIAMNTSSTKEMKALGDLYMKSGKKDNAITTYKKFLEVSQDSRIASLVGKSEFERKNYKEAVKYLGMVTGADAKKADHLSDYAMSAYNTGDTKKAEELFTTLMAVSPKDPEPVKMLYEIAQKANDTTKAVEHLKKYTDLKPSDAKMLQTLGDMLYNRKDRTGALAAYKGALKADPSAKGFLRRYVELVNTSGTAEEKSEALNKAIAAGEADAAMYEQLGESYKKAGNLPRAIQNLEKASQLDPKNSGLLISLAECQAQSGAIDAAILTYEQGIAMNPKADKEYKALGKLYMQQKKSESAIKNFKKYLENNKDDELAKIVGQEAFKAKNYTEAVKYLSMVSGADASAPSHLKMYAEACSQTKDDTKAFQLYKELSVKTPQDADVMKKLYEIAGKAGTKEEVLTYLKKYTALKPGDVEAQKVLANNLYERKDNAGALAAYRAIVKADPSVKGIYRNYAELALGAGNEAEITSVLNGAIAAGEADGKMYRKLAEIYSKQGNHVKATAMYEKASQSDPKDVSLLTDLAESQAKSGNTSAAILTYEQAIAMNPQASKEYKVLGDLYMQQKKTESAIKNYKKYLEKNKDNGLAKIVGEEAFKAKNYTEAVKYLAMVSGAEASTPTHLKMYAEACSQTKDDFKAYQLYKELSAKTPQDADVLKKLYEIAGKAGTKEEVLTYLKKYTALKPGDVEAQKVLADNLYESKDNAGALAAYRAIVKADPSVKGIYKRYAELALATGNEAEIASVLNGAIAAGEADGKMYKKMAEIYSKQGNHAKAVAMYEKASQSDPKDVSLLTDLAESQVKSGNTSAAILTYEQAIAMNPQASKEYKVLGDLYMQQKKTESAIKNYKKYLEKNKDNGLAKIVGQEAFKAKNYTEAVKYLAMVSGADASTPSHLKMYAEACSQTKDDFKAYQLYKELSAKTPQDADVLKKLYEIAGKAGTKDEVLLYLKKYTALKPGDVEAQKVLADNLYERKDNAGALAAYRAIVKAEPSVKGIYKKYAELALAAGKEAEIISVLNGAIAAGEADGKMYKKLAEIYSKQGNHAKAVAMYEKASQSDPKDVSLITDLAEAQAKSGNTSAAILTYEQAIAMNPQAGKEYKVLGDLYMQQKKTESAIKNYKKYLEKNKDNGLAKIVGQEAFKAKNYTEAVKYLAMVSGADASTPSHLKMYAEACSQTKDDFKAYQLYKELSVKTPRDADVLKKLYEIAGKAGTKDEVLLYLKKYAALKPGDVEAQKVLADNLYERKDNAGALAAYRAIVKADPSVKGIYKKYAELVMAGGNEAEIVAVLNGAIAAGEADGKMYKKLAEIYSKQNNHAKAVSMYERASQLDPKNASLLNELAESQLKSGNIDGSILTYEQAIAMNPKASKEYKTLGDLYLKQKKTDSAIRTYKKYLEKNRDNAAAKLVAENAYKQKNYQEAVKYFAMLSSPESSDPEVLMMYGQACSQIKDEFKAYQIFKQLAEVKPRDPVVFEKLYDIASRTGTKDEVLSYLRKYAELKPSDAAAQRKLADMLYEKKDERGALAAYRAALKADSTMKGIYKRYGQLVLASGTDDEKITAFNGAIAANEADGPMYKALGEIYQKRALYDNAIKMFEKASQLDPKDVNILNSLAECQLKKGSLIQATMTYEQIVALKPGAEKEYKQLGDLYMQQKKTDSAVKAYKKYLEKNPADGAIALIVGNTSFDAKNYPDAVKYLGMVTGPESKKASFLAKYAEAAYEAKDYPRAMRIYKELSVLTPKDAEVFKRLADVCEKTGAPDEALNNLRKYVELKPGDAAAQKTIGDALYDRKDMNGALQAYRSALKANPSLKGFYKRYVELVMKSSSKPDEKIAALNGAINAGEADASMYETLADLYKAAANYPGAIKMYEKASQLDPKNSKLLSSLAECQMKTGSLNEAAINLEQAIALNPSASTEYKQLGDLYMLQKKTDAAMNAYKKYLNKTSDSNIASLVAKNAYKKENYADAFKYYGMVKDDNSSEFIVEYGLSALKQKEYKTAISTLEKIRTMKGTIPQKNVALKALAEAYQKNGEAIKAAEILNEYVKLPGVKDPDASFSRAVAYETINPKMAVQMYEENVKAYPKDYRNFLKLGIYYARQSNGIQTAVKYLERCASITDTIGRVWLELGGLYAKLKRDQDMLRAYRKFIEIDPENAEASAKIGEILLAKKMTEDAMVFLEMANALKEDDPKVMTLLARGYIMTNRRDEGARLLEKVIKLSKGNIDDELRVELINVYLESNQFAKAADELKVMIAKKRDKDLLVKYARAVYELGRYKEVESIVADIKAVDPENLEAYMMLGKAKVAQKKYDDAIETYKEVLYIDQNYAPALCERANIYLIQGKLQWAKTFYDRALKADPKNGLVHLGLAKLAKQQKDYTTYSDHLEKARKLAPNSKEVQEELKTVRR